MSRVVVLGSLNVDLVTTVTRHPRPGETVLGEGLERLAGGKGANQAMAAAAAGARVVMVGAVGDDDGGRAYAARLRAAGVQTAQLRQVGDAPTGTALIAVDPAGENTIVVVPGANATLSADGVEASLGELDLATDDVLLVQLEVPLGVVAAACRHAATRGARVVLNIAPYADLPGDVLELADPVVANEHEAAALDEEPGSLVVTLGAQGARWGDQHVAAEPVGRVVDTTGAGDAFCGALAAALARGEDRERALTAAARAGAAACEHHGAQPDPRLA